MIDSLSVMGNSFINTVPEDDIIGTDESLESMVLQYFEKMSQQTTENKVQIMEMLNNPGIASSPEALQLIQNISSDDSLKLQLGAAHVRKAVAAIDTLLRA